MKKYQPIEKHVTYKEYQPLGIEMGNREVTWRVEK